VSDQARCEPDEHSRRLRVTDGVPTAGRRVLREASKPASGDSDSNGSTSTSCTPSIRRYCSRTRSGRWPSSRRRARFGTSVCATSSASSCRWLARRPRSSPFKTARGAPRANDPHLTSNGLDALDSYRLAVHRLRRQLHRRARPLTVPIAARIPEARKVLTDKHLPADNVRDVV
jgi:hypothetical protein